MTTKNVLYAAVGAPVVAARRVADAVAELRSTLNKEADTLGKTANKRVALWADEGERLVNRITDAKMVDDLTSKVDFDQVSNQVSKLRDQLEEMLTTWRASFRPEKMPTVKVEASPQAVKLEAKAPVRKPAGRKPQGRKTASPTTADHNSPGPKTAGPKTAGPKTAGPKTAGPKTAGKTIANKAPARKAAANGRATVEGAAKASSAKKASPRKASGTTTAKKATSTARKSVHVSS